MIYTSERLFREHLSGKKYRKYHIFIANYRGYPNVRFTLWQYTETGHLGGIVGCVDFSKFDRNHSLSDIRMPSKKKKDASVQMTDTVAAPADSSRSK